MKRKNNIAHKHIDVFNPDVILLDESSYQDLFFEYEGQDLPISAWIMKNIISYVNSLLDHVIGLKAVFLHSVPEAEKFYEQNGFHCMKENMRPLHSIDSEFTAMYLSLKEVHMIYDD